MSDFARFSVCEYLIYLRKSRQDNPLESVEEVLSKHEAMLQEFALKNYGYRIPEENIYREVESAETIDDRIEIKRMFDRMENGSIKGVLVVDPQRLTRGDLLDCGTVVHAFRYTNTLVVTPTKTYDLTDKYDRKFFEMELTRGGDYLEYTKEILSRGRVASVKKGNFISSTPPYGYDRAKIDNAWTLVINETEANYVRMAFKMFLDGYGVYAISKRLNELGAKPRKSLRFTEGTVRQMLNNVTYAGKIKWNERVTVKELVNGKVVKKRKRTKDYDVYDGNHEAIIDYETFQKVQDKVGSGARVKSSYELRNLYAGILKCKRCGSIMNLRHYQKDGVDYRKPRLHCRSGLYCDNKSANYIDVHNAIVEALKSHLEDFTVKVDMKQDDASLEREAILQSLENQLIYVDEKMEAICEHLENGIYTVEMFISRKAKLEEEKDRLLLAIENAKNNNEPTLEEMQDKIATFHEALDLLDDESVSVKTKNEFLKKIIEVIYYDRTDDVTLDIRLK